MRNRILFTLLFSLSILVIILALGYAYYDIKDAQGLVLDPDGHPIPNAAVTIAGRSTLSDTSGQFRLSVPRGTFAVIGMADGFTPAETRITVDSLFDKAVDVNLTLPLNVFTATVVAQDSRQPIVGAAVQVEGGPGLMTDANGAFMLRGVKRGVRFQISASGYRAAGFTYDSDGPHEFALAPALTTIQILDEYTGLPLPNAAISAGDQGGQTDAAGALVLRAVMTGTVIAARAPEHGAAQTVFNGEDTLSLRLRPNTFDGVVRDAATQKPISNALILYNNQILPVDERGALRIEKPGEAMTLTVKVPGYQLTTFAITRTAQMDLKLQPFKVKGIHLYYAMPRADVLALLDRLAGTDVNAVVLDVKEGAGDVVWPSAVPLAKQLNAYHAHGIPPEELVQICRQRHWYCIARQVIFKDVRLGSARPDLALHYQDGRVLNAGNEIWMNPAKKEVWEYDLALAKELSAMGFDEVQFDYIRYPGQPTPLEYGTAETRIATIRSFLEYAAATFKPWPTFFSGDVFGLTTAVHDEQGIGQLLEVDAPYFDYISPMMYPSTWKGSPNLFRDSLGNPNCPAALACPYDIIYKGTVLAQQRGKTLVRPWLQAYRDAGFDVAEYIAQKKGADDANSAGWLYWNNQGIYPDSMFVRGGASQ
ncbi:MAG: putative glycoside hydrolase [Anaerolineae bacterium]